MNSAIANVLNKVLGDFVEDFNAEQLNISLFSGKLHLAKMKIKPQALEQFGLPVVLRYGIINSIEATIPWTSLSTSPLKVEVKGVYLLFSPKTPNLWSNESIEQSLIDKKLSQLARFEFLSSDQLAATQSPGFVEKLVTKIIDNLQVSLSNVYVRLEDFTSSSEPFAMGLIVKSAEIATCNHTWQPEFVIDSPITYKSAEIRGFALYMDYGPGCEVDCSKIPGKTLEKSFENLSRQESDLHFLIKHRFILSACGCTWRLVLNKNSQDLSRPQISLEMTLGSSEEGIKCGTELKQVTHIVKFMEFCGKFSTFAAGVKANFVPKDFTDIEGEEYRRLYMEWFLKPSEERPSLETDLKILEKVYAFDGIVRQRRAAKAELKLLEQEEEAKRTLSTVATEGKTSGFTSFFSFRKSKAVQEQEELEHKQRIEAAEIEIRNAREARERFKADLAGFLENTSTFTDLPDTYERFVFRVVLNSTTWTLVSEDKELISSYLAGSSCDLWLRVAGVKVAINSSAFTLIDHIDHSDAYPHFLETSNCVVEYVDFPEAEKGKTLDVVTGDSFCTLNFTSIFTLISEIKRVIVAEVDVDYYRELLEGKVRDLVQKGKEYMQRIALEGMAPQSLLVSISCKAPCFIIPFDVRQKRALIADFGLLTLKTQPATRDWDKRGETQPKEAVYDSYLFTASDFVLATLWDFTVAKQWKSGTVEKILTPSPFILTIGSAVFPEINPAIEVAALMESVNGTFSDLQFQFLLQLKDRILGLKDKYFPSDVQTLTIEELEEVTEKELLKDQMKLQGKVLSQRVTLEVQSVNLELVAAGVCISQFTLSAFRGELNLYPNSQCQAKISTLGIAVRDTRPDQQYPMIVCMRTGSEVPVVDVLFDLNPAEDKIEIAAKLTLLSVMVNPEFLLTIAKFVSGEPSTEKMSARRPSKTMVRRQTTIVKETVAKSNLLRKLMFVRVHCSKFSLLVPEAQNSKKLSHLRFDCVAEYSSKMEYFDWRNEKGNLVSRDTVSTEDFVDGQIQQLEVSTGGLEVPADLYSFKSIKPGILTAARAEVKLRQISHSTEAEIVLSLDIRQLGLLIGFADIRSLLYTKDFCVSAFSAKPGPEYPPMEIETDEVKPQAVATYSISLFSDEITAVLIDDTVTIAHSLLRFRIPTISLSLKYSNSHLQAAFAVSLALEYHNGTVSAYEPLLENWTLDVNSDQNPGNPLSIVMISRTPLTVNLSHAAAFILSRVLQKLQGGVSTWEPCLQSAQLPTSTVHYKLKNKLGVPLVIWVEDSTFTLVLSPGQTHIISEEIWKIEKQSSGKASNPIHALSIQIEPYGTACGVMIDEVGLSGYKLASGDEGKVVICRVETQPDYRLVTFEGDMKVCNNTEQSLAVQWKEENMVIAPSKSFSVPIFWVFSDIQLLAPKRAINFRLCSQFRVDDTSFAVLDRVHVKCDSEIQTVYFINPPITVRNLMPGAVTAVFQSRTFTIPAGGECRVYTESSTTGVQCAWELNLGRGMTLASKVAQVIPGKNHCNMTGEGLVGKYELGVECVNNEELRCGKVDLRFEKVRKKDFSGKLVTLQAGLWIVNHTSYFLNCSDETNTQVEVTPSHFSICTFSSPSLKVCLNPHTFGKVSSWSKQFNTETAGLAGVVSLETNFSPQPNVSLGIWVEHGTWPIVNTRILHIYPRFVIKNSLPYAVFLKQYKDKRSGIRLEPEQRVDYQFQKDGSFIQVSTDEQNWSSAFNIEDIGSFQIRFPYAGCADESNPWWMPNSVAGPMVCAQVNVTSDNQAMIVTTFEVPESPDFLVRNETNDYLSVCQQGCKDKTIVAPGTSVPFVYDDHASTKRKLRVMMGKVDQLYNIEKIGKSRKKFGNYHVETYVHSASRVLHIYAERDRASLMQQSTSRFANWKVVVQLNSLSVALVDEEPKEIILLSIPFVQVTVSSGDATFQDSDRTELYLNLILPSLQVDNMCSKPQEFPVILSQLIRQDEEPTPFLQLELKRTIERKGQDTFECFEYIRISLQEVQISLHQATVLRLAKVVQKVLRPFESQLQLEPFPETAAFSEIYPSLIPGIDTVGQTGRHQRKSYFQLIVIYGAIVNLSIKTSPHKVNAMIESSQTFTLNRAIQRVGAALINISNSRLKFTTVMLKDSFSSSEDISSKILQNYLRQGYWQVYRLIGSSDMLGNPIGLINKLGSGVFELFNEPRKGLLQGPQEFANGVRRGVKSFISNVISGGMGSVSKITGSFYGLLREAQGDQDGYERINRPDSASSGVLEGLKGGFTDLAEGVTGIITKPVEGIKKGGFGGFLRGVKSGIVGAVTAPMSAVLRTGTTITSSMAQSASKLSTIIPPTRIRLPRQVNTRKVLEPYNDNQAEIQATFRGIPQYRKEKLFYSAKCRTGTVVLTQRFLVQIVSQTEVKSVSFEDMSRADLTYTVETGLCVVDKRGDRIDILGRRETVLEIHAAVRSMAKNLVS